MFCILSQVKIEDLMKISIPVKDKYDNANLSLFYDSNQGKEFSLIDPLKTYRSTNKYSIIDEIQSILGFCAVVYNCPIYIYVMTDNWYYKNLKGMRSVMFSHLYKLTKYQEIVNSSGFSDKKAEELRINNKDMYYEGNFDLLESEIIQVMSVINLHKQPLWSFCIDRNNNFRMI